MPIHNAPPIGLPHRNERNNATGLPLFTGLLLSTRVEQASYNTDVSGENLYVARTPYGFEPLLSFEHARECVP